MFRRVSFPRTLLRFLLVLAVLAGQAGPLAPTAASGQSASRQATASPLALPPTGTPTPVAGGPAPKATPTSVGAEGILSGSAPSGSNPDKGTPRQTSGAAVITSISYQTITSSGPLLAIHIGSDLSCQVTHVDDSSYEFYPPTVIPGDCGTFVVVDDALYAPDFGNHDWTATGALGSHTPFTPVSQSAVTGSGTSADPYRVSTVVDVGSTGLRITQTDSYVVGQDYYQTDVQIANSSGTSRDVIVYRAGDCYLANSDYGYGSVDASSGSVACLGSANRGSLGRSEIWVPLTGNSHHYEARYNEVWAAIGTHAPFDDTCRCPEDIDNGAGLSWSLTVANGGQTAVSHLTSFATGLPGQPAPTGSESRQAGSTRDPVNTLTGSFTYSHRDMATAGRGPSPAFARAYNSYDTRVSSLGLGWTHAHNAHLANPADGSQDVLLVEPNGTTDRYIRNQDGTYTPPPAVYTTLVKNGDGTYTATHPDQTTWTFRADGRLTAIADRHGNQSTLTYNASGQLASIGDPAGRGSLTLTYDTCFAGRLCSVSDWLSPARTVQFQYDASGRLWKVTDREGKVTSYGYDGTSHRLTTITDARGHIAVTNTYDAEGRVETQKDARGLVTGQQTTFQYVTNPDGTKTTTVTYPVTSLDGNWHFTEVDNYDAEGRLTSRVSKPTASSADDVTVGRTYDANSNLASVTDGRGNTTNFCYDTAYDGTGIAGSHGNLARVIGPPPTAGANRPVTLYQYDGKDNLTQTVPPKGVASGTTVTCATDLSGAINSQYATDMAYDTATQTKMESVTSRYTDPDLGARTGVTKFEYTDAANPGLVTKVIPPRGNTGPSPDYTYATTNAYYASGSKAGLLQSVTDPLGHVTTYDYDAVGRRTSMVDPNGNAQGGVPADHTWTYEYDQEDRLRFSRAPAPSPGGAQLVSEYRYDEVGNRIVVIDPNGQVTRYVYDERDGLKEVHESPSAWTDPAATPNPEYVTEYQYDHLGNLSRVTRAKGDGTYERATDYAYDGLNRVRRESQYPSWPSTSGSLVSQYTYDKNDNRLTLLDPLGQTTTYGYDALNRLTSVSYSDGQTPGVTFVYDANGNRTSMADGTGATTNTYDERDRLLSATSPGSVVVGYRYDLDGNRTKVIYPDGTAVTYTFDKTSRLASLLDWASCGTGYEYNPDGSLKAVTNCNGTTASYTYDNALRLTGLWNKEGSDTISRHTYTLDAVGNRTQVVEALGQQQTGGVWAWGGNWWGQIGEPPYGGRTTPGQVGGIEGATKLVAGSFHTLALRGDGTVWAWGTNDKGRLGDGTTIDSYIPVQVVGLTGVVAVAGGGSHSLALKADGTVWAWGANSSGQLGDGTLTDRWTPVQVSGLSGVTAISAGGSHSLALKSDGTVWAWGENEYGQIGDGSTKVRKTPVLVSNLTGAIAIAAGINHSLAVKSNGTVWAWGRNSNGQLGDGTITNRKSAVQVSGITGATAVAAGYVHSLALKSDGTVWAWGANSGGQLGDGSYTERHTPVQVSGLTGVAVIARGYGHSLALKSDATLWAWGINIDGQLGDGTTTDRNVPIQVSGLSNVTAASGGVQHTAAIAAAAGGERTVVYGYDRLYRLTSVDAPDQDTAYAYDPVGNRLTMTRVTAVNYTYDRADRITAVGVTSYTVNANGNLVARGSDTFGYDQANRLKTATVSGAASTYAYDGDGKRASKTVGTNTTNYTYDANRSLPVVLDDGARKYVWGIGLAYAEEGTSVLVYHTDGLGSVRAITDAAGQVVQTYRTDEFGVPAQGQGNVSQPFGYTGQQYDDEAGLVYLRARYYEPKIGRFMSRDRLPGSALDPRSLHRYTYAMNRPVHFTDPAGLETWGSGSALMEASWERAAPSIRLCSCGTTRVMSGSWPPGEAAAASRPPSWPPGEYSSARTRSTSSASPAPQSTPVDRRVR